MAKKASTRRGGAPRTRATAPRASAAKPRAIKTGDNHVPLTFAQEQSLFLDHRRTIGAALALEEAAKKKRQDAEALARGDGFPTKLFKIARDLATTRGEARVEGDVGDRLKVARFIGHKMGAQWDLFEQASAKPEKSVDRAYDEGRQASAENRPAQPAGSPGSPEYDAHMRGFHDHQGSMLGRGIREPNGPATGATE